MAYPTAYSSRKCGGGAVGIVDYGVRTNKSEVWDVFCYRMKGKALARSGLQAALLPGHPAKPAPARLPRRAPASRGVRPCAPLLPDVNCTCKAGYVGDGTSCSGNLLQVLMSSSTLNVFLTVGALPGRLASQWPAEMWAHGRSRRLTVVGA